MLKHHSLLVAVYALTVSAAYLEIRFDHASSPGEAKKGRSNVEIIRDITETQRSEKIQMAKLAELAERYDDMSKAMKAVVTLGTTLSSEERNLFSVAYKNIAGARRSAWRIISSLEQKETDDFKRAVTENYRKRIEGELKEICSEVLVLVDKYLLVEATIPPSDDSDRAAVENKVSYLKMKGDYNRYLAEISTGPEREELVKESHEAYVDAFAIAESELPPNNPIRLGLALNLSVFYYEIGNNPEKALMVGSKAFRDAIATLDQLREESYKDSTLILQLLKDTLMLWTSENDEEEGDDN